MKIITKTTNCGYRIFLFRLRTLYKFGNIVGQDIVIKYKKLGSTRSTAGNMCILIPPSNRWQLRVLFQNLAPPATLPVIRCSIDGSNAIISCTRTWPVIGCYCLQHYRKYCGSSQRKRHLLFHTGKCLTCKNKSLKTFGRPSKNQSPEKWKKKSIKILALEDLHLLSKPQLDPDFTHPNIT